MSTANSFILGVKGQGHEAVPASSSLYPLLACLECIKAGSCALCCTVCEILDLVSIHVVRQSWPAHKGGHSFMDQEDRQHESRREELPTEPRMGQAFTY